MIGKIIIVVIFFLILIMSIQVFLVHSTRETMNKEVNSIMQVFIDDVSEKGIIDYESYDELLEFLKKWGVERICLRLDRKLGGQIYDVVTKKDQIIDKSLKKGDILTVVALTSKSEKVFKKAKYIKHNNSKEVFGYHVIQKIATMDYSKENIYVKNDGQLNYRVYDENNIAFGDDECEKYAFSDYIFPYCLYDVISNELDNGKIAYWYSMR